MPRIIRPQPASSNPTYGSDANYLWWLAGAAGLLWLLTRRSAEATTPIDVEPGSAPSPGRVRAGETLVQRLARDPVARIEFYLQSTLYAWSMAANLPDGVWSPYWQSKYEAARRLLAAPPEGVDPETPAGMVAIVNAATYYNAGPRVVPVELLVSLRDQINAEVRALVPDAVLLQVRT